MAGSGANRAGFARTVKHASGGTSRGTTRAGLANAGGAGRGAARNPAVATAKSVAPRGGRTPVTGRTGGAGKLQSQSLAQISKGRAGSGLTGSGKNKMK